MRAINIVTLGIPAPITVYAHLSLPFVPPALRLPLELRVRIKPI